MKYLVCFLMFAIINTCTKRDVIRNNPLSGSWELVSYGAGRLFEEFDAGEVILTFDVAEEVLTVENNYVEKRLNIPASGKYTYTQKIAQINIQDETFMNGTTTLDFKFEGKNLVLSNKPEVDGPIMVLSKIE